jgi:type IV pilus assembly protein PilP
MKMTVRILAVLTLVTALCISGCKKKEEPVASQPAQQSVLQATKPKLVVQGQMSSSKIPRVPLSPVFGSQKDPFKPYVTDVKSQVQSARKNRFGQEIPILSYEVSQFTVSGIIVGLKENSALLIDPAGKPYVVKAGMEIGRNAGRITKITPSYLEVFETYRDENGKLVKNTVKLALPKKE